MCPSPFHSHGRSGVAGREWVSVCLAVGLAGRRRHVDGRGPQGVSNSGAVWRDSSVVVSAKRETAITPPCVTGWALATIDSLPVARWQQQQHPCPRGSWPVRWELGKMRMVLLSVMKVGKRALRPRRRRWNALRVDGLEAGGRVGRSRSKSNRVLEYTQLRLPRCALSPWFVPVLG